MSFENIDEMTEIKLFYDALISALQVQKAGFEKLMWPVRLMRVWFIYCVWGTRLLNSLPVFSRPLRREAQECRRLGARAALRRVQREEREAGAAREPLVQASGHPVRHVPHRLLGETRPHWQDAHPAAHRRKGSWRETVAVAIVGQNHRPGFS